MKVLPLRPAAFSILAALADGPKPGIDILETVNATVPGRPLFGPGTLYRLMREMREDGLIARATAGAGQDERRALHKLTAEGRAVLRAEAARLRRTLKLASSAGE
jgi:PadR family transcriptional regulator PadR